MKKAFFLLLGTLLCFTSYSQNQNSVQKLELKVVKGQYDSAIHIASELLESDSLNWTLNYYLGNSYQAKYNYFEALKAFEKANLLDTANYIIENALAGIYEIIGKDEQAIDLYYNQYLRDTTKIEPIVNLANIFRNTREYGSAIHYYQEASAIDPENFYYYKQQGFCISKINMPVPAIFAYEMALMLNPYDLNVYVQLANIQNSERYFKDAIRTCKKGLLNYPNENQLMKIKAYAYYLNKDFDSSIIEFNKILEFGDTSFFNLKYRGLAHFEKKEFKEAIVDLKMAYELNDEDAELCFFLGSALGRSDENKEGMAFLEKSVKILMPSPVELSNIYSEMAYIFLNQEKYELSLEHLKLAYRNNATPMLSFKMAQLYDYYLKNKKLAIDCYEGYLTMVNVADSTLEANRLTNAFLENPVASEYANERIKVLKEELFFEEGLK
jgi:tetratricopeptide (TPR) repeat protein